MKESEYEQAIEKSQLPGASAIRANMPLTPATPGNFEPPNYAALEAFRQERRAWRVWEVAGVPKRHALFPVGSTHLAWNAKRDGLVKLLGQGFLVALLGERGTGKTRMAVEILWHHIQISKHGRPLYVRAVDVFMDIREAYRPKGPTERERVEQFTSPTLLVIDDAHERGGSDWENRLLAYIIDRRYGDQVDTLLISNQQPDEFKLSIGPSIYSRLVETGGIVVCDWPSFRHGEIR